MRYILNMLTGLVICISSYAQNDTIVKVNNNLIVGKIIEITSYSVIIKLPEPNETSQIEIGQHLIAYIRYENGELIKFKYNRWQRRTIKKPLLKNGFYYDIEIGYCLYQKVRWNIDPISNQVVFYDDRKNLGRISFNLGNRWSIYKTSSYNLSLGINWLNLSFSPTEFHLFETSLYDDWMFTASPINPELTNTFILNNNGAIEQYFGGGYMNHLGEETDGFMIRSGVKYRYKKIGFGANYVFGKTRDRKYGFPITLNTVNLTFGLKF